MAAVSAPQARSALTPPSSSHGGQAAWKVNQEVGDVTLVLGDVDTNILQSNNTRSKSGEYSRQPLTSNTNGSNLNHQGSRSTLSKRTDMYGSQITESGHLAPAYPLLRKGSSISENGSANDSLLDLYGTAKPAMGTLEYGEKGLGKGIDVEDDDPGWIHRDKLARIESQELQAAGIILPRARATSKSSRRDRSRDAVENGSRSEGQKQQKIAEPPVEEEESTEPLNWDLRTPEEAAEDQRNGYRDVSGGGKGSSRIPLSKTSPVPVPLEHLERETPVPRKPSNGWTEDDITYPRSRGRSTSMKEDIATTPTPAKRLASDSTSPTKKTPSTRKTSAPPSQRPKTRSGPREASNQRPSTRSGELNPTKCPEGDPPWVTSMYKPDPRLPPEQQLLPTVAKRLQQEQWEKEGKFGHVYDTEFRPMSGEYDQNTSYSPPPPQRASASPPDDQIIKTELEVPIQKSEGDWPLRKSPVSPTLSTGTPATASGQGSYSTMPKITGREERLPKVAPPTERTLPKTGSPVREPRVEGEEKTKKMCGCCVVM